MITIRTKFIGATDTKGARVRATGAGRQLTVPYNYEVNDMHLIAAVSLARSLDTGVVRLSKRGETRSGDGYVYEVTEVTK